MRNYKNEWMCCLKMIKTVNILYGICSTIRSVKEWETADDCDILISNNEEDIKNKTFHIKVVMGSNRNQINKQLKKASVYITYIIPEITDNSCNFLEEEYMNVMDKLTNLFSKKMEIKVGRKHRAWFNPKISYLNDNKTIVLDYEYFDKNIEEVNPNSDYDDLIEIIKRRYIVRK